MNNYFQILACNEVVGTCCSDYGLVTILDIMRQFLEIIQIVVPIILIVGLTIQFTQMMISPDNKKGPKSLYNRLAATVICFFLPFVVNLVLSILPNTFQISACWETAKASKEVLNRTSDRYISPTDKKAKKVLVAPEDDDSDSNGSSNSNQGGIGQGSSTGKAIVQLAESYVGGKYCWGGKDPNICADCSGFVSYIFGRFNINLASSTVSMWADTSKYTLVTDGNIKAGDVVMYQGHVGILTGNGNEIVHAKGDKYGIVVDSNYKYSPVKGIMRINGVN